MSKLFFISFLVVYCLSAIPVYAAIHPQPGSTINFRQILFEYDEMPEAEYYIITIRETDNPGETKPVFSVKNSSLAFVQDSGFYFGMSYAWSVEGYKGKEQIGHTVWYTFKIGSSFQTNGSWFHARVTNQVPGAFSDGIIFLDYMGIAVNRKGEPVWYMPLAKDSLDQLKMRNVKMTTAGTITYLDNTDCFEKDIYARQVWKAPNDGKVSGDQQEYYHHDFFKMEDGTYITSGYRFVKKPNIYNKSQITRVRYNTIIQYDRNGVPIWYWDEEKHISDKIIFGENRGDAAEISGTHLNGLAYYKNDDAFIASFRDNSSVLKISHRNGNVLYNLGDTLKKYNPAEIPFSSQHGPSLLRDGSIVLYNNNLDGSGRRDKPAYPIVRVFSQPGYKKQSVKKWEYECMSDQYPDGIRGKEGYASQLPYNDNLLVCMGGANYIFEVNPAKKVVWQCSFEKLDEISNEWTAINNYRCSYASSLYPCYFTLQHIRLSNTSGKVFATVQVNNEGSEIQTFVIEPVNSPGKQTFQNKSVIIAARSSENVTVDVTPAALSGNGKVYLNVYPLDRKLMSRAVSF